MSKRPRRPQRPYQNGEHKVWGRLELPPLAEAKFRSDVAEWDAKWGAEVAEERWIRRRAIMLAWFVIAGAGVFAKAQMWGIVQ